MRYGQFSFILIFFSTLTLCWSKASITQMPQGNDPFSDRQALISGNYYAKQDCKIFRLKKSKKGNASRNDPFSDDSYGLGELEAYEFINIKKGQKLFLKPTKFSQIALVRTKHHEKRFFINIKNILTEKEYLRLIDLEKKQERFEKVKRDIAKASGIAPEKGPALIVISCVGFRYLHQAKEFIRIGDNHELRTAYMVEKMKYSSNEFLSFGAIVSVIDQEFVEGRRIVKIIAKSGKTLYVDPIYVGSINDEVTRLVNDYFEKHEKETPEALNKNNTNHRVK